jgi:predicted fused transcriptional regulator/phosphomethylpyrimidine kinase
MTQLIIKDKKVMCRTTVPYPPDIIKAMKKAGYKIKEVPDKNVEGEIKNVRKR